MERPCPNCRTPCVKDAKECHKCGASLGTGTPPVGSLGVQAPPVFELPRRVAVPSGQQRVCPRCGYIALSNAAQCTHCDELYGVDAVLVPALFENRYWVAIETTVTCGSCGHTSPLNHLDVQRAVCCLRCGTEQRFDGNQWWGALAHAHAIADLAGPHPEGRFPNEFVAIHRQNPFSEIGVTVVSGAHETARSESPRKEEHTLNITAAPGHPLCSHCAAPLSLTRIDPPEMDVHCPRCASAATYELPEGVRAKAPYFVGILSKEHEKGRIDVRVARDDAGTLSVRCPLCAHPVNVSSHLTMVHCDHCGTDSRVTAQALRLLGFERPKTTTWWALLEGPSRLRSKLERSERKAQSRQPAPRIPHSLPPPRPKQVLVPAPQDRGRPRVLLLAALVGVAAILAAAALWLFSPHEESDRDTAPALAAIPTPEHTASQEAPMDEPSFSTSWSATVTRAKNAKQAIGTNCTLEAKVVGGDLDWVRLQCEDTTLYDSRSPAEGEAKTESTLSEQAADGQFTYVLDYEDTGPRLGRAQIVVDGAARSVRIFHLSTGDSELDLLIDERSSPRLGPSCTRCAQAAKR